MATTRAGLASLDCSNGIASLCPCISAYSEMEGTILFDSKRAIGPGDGDRCGRANGLRLLGRPLLQRQRGVGTGLSGTPSLHGTATPNRPPHRCVGELWGSRQPVRADAAIGLVAALDQSTPRGLPLLQRWPVFSPVRSLWAPRPLTDCTADKGAAPVLACRERYARTRPPVQRAQPGFVAASGIFCQQANRDTPCRPGAYSELPYKGLGPLASDRR